MKLKINLCCKLLMLISLVGSAQEVETNSIYIKNFEKSNNVLEFEGIRMTNHTGLIKRSQIYYGEKVDFHYDNITGFKLTDSIAYPDMNIYALDVKGDTVMSKENLFNDLKEEFKESILDLFNSVTFADPFLPGKTYSIHVEIIDKKSDAFYHWNKSFTIINHPRFLNDVNGVKYDILYLYSGDRDISITDNLIMPFEQVYFIVEGLEGFVQDENGMVSIECSVTITDSNNEVLVTNPNMIPNPVEAKELKKQIFGSITVDDQVKINPINCSIAIKDRWSDKYLKSQFNLVVNKE